MRDGYQRHTATHMGCAQQRAHTAAHGPLKTHECTHRYTSQGRESLQTHRKQTMHSTTCAHPTHGKPVEHMHAYASVHTEHIHSCLLSGIPSYLPVSSHLSQHASIIIHLPPLVFWVFFFPSIKFQGICHIPYFHHRRQPCSPAAAQKSKVLSNTPV